MKELPDSGGYVVWLEAPYGFGKSVLAAQGVAQLEDEGWRCVWLKPEDEPLNRALARALGQDLDTPWSLLLEALWSPLTVLVLDNLRSAEQLAPLLGQVSGLLWLTSRVALHDPELLRLQATGMLLHLNASDLAFTALEAAELVGDLVLGEQLHRRSQGWPLPLHLAALTGVLPEKTALIEGIRQSLDPVTWNELLLLASLAHLPRACTVEATLRLSACGFAQELEEGFRLHPLAAEGAFEQHAEAVAQAVRTLGTRLPPLLHAEALERTGQRTALGDLLEHSPGLGRAAPALVVRWDDWAGGERGAARLLEGGEALCLLGRREQGRSRLLAAAAHPQARDSEKLAAWRELVFHTADDDLERARSYDRAGQNLLERVAPLEAARFLNASARLEYLAGAHEPYEAKLRRVLDLHAQADEGLRPLGPLNNLAVSRWYRLGDLEGFVTFAEEVLGWEPPPPALQMAVLCWNLALYRLLLGREAAARDALERTLAFASVRPLVALQARVYLATLDRDFAPIPHLLEQIARWERPWVTDLTLARWAFALIDTHRAGEALEWLGEATGDLCTLARALALGRLEGDGGIAARAALPPAPNPLEDRDTALFWHAVNYRLSLKESDLEPLLHLTLSGERVLPGLIPLEELPRSRPKLARSYPLVQVLTSGWREAIRLRLGEIPPLELTVLGGVRVRRLGEEVTLTQRPREILLLTLLGQPRAAIAELLWPDLEPEKMRNNLHFTLNALRKALEPWGVPTYLLEAGLVRFECDLTQLEAALKAQDALEVLRLYQGDLAPDVDLTPLNEVRDALREEVVDCLLAGVTTQPTQAEPLLERVLQLDPLHEAALSALLERWMARGRRAAAQRRYAAFVRRFQAELGELPTLIHRVSAMVNLR